MKPSSEIREVATALYEQAWLCEERMVKAEDEGVDQGRLGRLEQSCLEAWKDYEDFVGAEGFDLLTEASGSVLRCAETNIPLCDLDECIETETGQLMIVKQAA